MSNTNRPRSPREEGEAGQSNKPQGFRGKGFDGLVLPLSADESAADARTAGMVEERDHHEDHQ